MYLSPIIDTASGENHRDLGHCGQRGNVRRKSGITFELMRLLVENIEAVRRGPVWLMDILRKDLRGNMINLKPESENFSRKGHQFMIHSIHIQYSNTRNFMFILLFTGRCQGLSHV